MPLILQLETSTDVCSVALSKGGELIYLSETFESNSHSEKLTLQIDECMNNSGYQYQDLDAIAVSDGPGSYTSLRIGVSTAKGISFVTGCPLLAIDSLEILAHGIKKNEICVDDYILPMIDARRMEVYAAIFDPDCIKINNTEAVILEQNSFLNYLQGENRLLICGSGSVKFNANFPSPNIILRHKHTSASFMSLPALAKFESKAFSNLAYYSPNYFKAPNITKSNKILF